MGNGKWEMHGMCLSSDENRERAVEVFQPRLVIFREEPSIDASIGEWGMGKWENGKMGKWENGKMGNREYPSPRR